MRSSIALGGAGGVLAILGLVSTGGAAVLEQVLFGGTTGADFRVLEGWWRWYSLMLQLGPVCVTAGLLVVVVALALAAWHRARSS